MKKQIFTLLCACLMSEMLFAQSTWFNDKDLTLTGVYYYPEHWDESQWERDFKQMHDLGFEFTHFAEFAWAQLEPEEGKYDFAWLDKAIALADKYKLKVVMCTSTATPPVWLSRKYPEILIKYEGYIGRERMIADKLARLESIKIKGKFDYNAIQSLSTEARQKLVKIDPETIAQASRIPGVSPSDINVLLVLSGR